MMKGGIKMGEKWPIYFLPPFWVSKWSYIALSVHCRPAHAREQSERRERLLAGAAGSKLAESVIRSPFTERGPQSMCHFSAGIKKYCTLYAGSGGGLSGF